MFKTAWEPFLKFGRCVHLRENEKDPFNVENQPAGADCSFCSFPHCCSTKKIQEAVKEENTKKKELSVFNDIGYICTFSTADFQ